MWFNPFQLKKKQKLHPFFWVVAGLVGVGSMWILRPYLSMALMAFVVATLFSAYYDWLEKWLGGRKSIASLLGVVSLMGGFMTMAILLLNVVVQQVIEFGGELSRMAVKGNYSADGVIETANYWLGQLPWEVPLIDAQEIVQTASASVGKMGSLILNNLVSIGNSSLSFAFKAFIFSVFLYIFLPSVKELKQVLFALSPMDDAVDNLYYSRTLAMLQSLLKGTFVITLVQSIIGMILLAVVGVEYLGFWLAMMLLIGLIPGGVGVVLVPLGIGLVLFGSVWQGIVVVLGSLLIVGSIDNLLRPLLISKEVELRPVFVLLGMFGGVQAFGLIGILYGPVIMVMLKTTIEVMLGRRG